MTRQFSTLIAITFVLFLFSCKPAAEDRVKMHENAKRISDSIAKTIDIPLSEVTPTAPIISNTVTTK